MEEQKGLNKYYIFQPLLLATMVILGIVLGKKIEESSTPQSKIKLNNVPSVERSKNAVEEASRFIQARFIDSIDLSKLNDLAIKNMVRELDPYSSYLASDNLIEIPFTSFQDAYGFNVSLYNNQWLVDKISPESNVWDSNLEIGDQLIKLNNNLINANSFTKWDDTILRAQFKSFNEYQSYEFRRMDLAKKKSITAVYALSDKICYFRINRFGDTVYDEFITAVDSLYKKKLLSDFIIDLRDNSGGYMEECIRVLNQFFKDKNTLLAYTEGRAVRKIEYKSDGRQLFNLGKLVVLINGGSASASEVFAGAIQDLERGRVIGEHSYGKGLVQEQYMLSNGAALRLSVSRFYLPSGRSVEKTGNGINESTKYYSSNKKLLHAGKYIYPDIYLSQSLANSSQATDEIIMQTLLTYRQKYGTSGKDPKKTIFNSIINTRKRWSATEKKKLLEDISIAWGVTLKDTKSIIQYRLLSQPIIQSAIKALK